MREVLEVPIEGNRLVGTAHWPAENREGAPGILIMNSGFLPRSPAGDTTTHICDHFARRGYACFRFDMPGLGDSEGELSVDVETFNWQVTSGAHASVTEALTHHLVKKYKLSALYVGGICGAAVTAIYVGASGKSSPLAGVFLFDPHFALITVTPKGSNPNKPIAATVPAKTGLQKQFGHRYELLRAKVLANPAGLAARKAYRTGLKPGVLALKGAVRKMRGEPLPADANLPVINGAKTILKKGIPTLLLLNGTREEHAEKYDYVKHIAAAGPDKLTVDYLPGVTHSFAEANGEQLMIKNLDQWLPATKSRPEKPTAPARALQPATA